MDNDVQRMCMLACYNRIDELLTTYASKVTDVGTMRKIADHYTRAATWDAVSDYGPYTIDANYEKISRLWGGPPDHAPFFTPAHALGCNPLWGGAISVVIYRLPNVGVEWTPTEGTSPLMRSIIEGHAQEALCRRGCFFTADEQRLDAIVELIHSGDFNMNRALAGLALAGHDEFVRRAFDFSPTKRYNALQICCTILDPDSLFLAIPVLLKFGVDSARVTDGQRAADIVVTRAAEQPYALERHTLHKCVGLLSRAGGPPAQPLFRQARKRFGGMFPDDVWRHVVANSDDGV